MATVIRRPGPKNSIVWQAQVRKKGYPSQIKTFDRKGDAQKWAKMIEHQIKIGLWKNAKEASQVSLTQALHRYLNTVTPHKRPATQTSEHLSARTLREFMGNLSLLQITPEKVAEYRDKRLESVSANTVRIELALLSHLFNIAEREWSFHGLDNPVRHISKPKIPKDRCPSLSEEQIIRLLDECKKSTSRLLHAFSLLTLHTGCRSMELRKLRWPQVFLNEGYISLVATDTKIHRSRIVPLTPAAQEILRNLRASICGRRLLDTNGNPVRLVFPAQGHADRPQDMHIAFDQAVRRAGLDSLPGFGKFRIHDLRHLCGTFMVMTGSDLETVRDILGHRNLSTTQRYLHMANEHKKSAISKIGHLGLGN